MAATLPCYFAELDVFYMMDDFLSVDTLNHPLTLELFYISRVLLAGFEPAISWLRTKWLEPLAERSI